MKVRFYYQQLLRINTEEVARLPPFRANQALGDEELLDVILFGTPKSWQKEMDRQGYDPMNHPLHEVVDFLENVESAEEFDHSKDSKKANTKSSKTKKESGRQGAYCMLHGQGNHSTEDCIKLKAEAKRLKSGNSSSGQKSQKAGKTWGGEATNAADKTKKDLAAMVKKTVQKEVKAAEKKRKASDDDDSSVELALIDIEKQLKDFNYDDEASC